MPFKHVYFGATGIVRDKPGRKMSKSLGNSPDPLVLIDKLGADGAFHGYDAQCSSRQRAFSFDESSASRDVINNKIWNAFRLVKGWETADIG